MENIFVLPSVIALALKMVVFWRARTSYSSASPYAIIILAALFCANFIEFLGFCFFGYFSQNVEYTLIPITIYYAALASFSFAILALSLSTVNLLTRLTFLVFVCVWGAAIIALFTPGFVIAGIESVGYVFTRIKGPAYAVGPLAFLVPNFIAFFVLVYGVIKKVGDIRTESAALLGVLLPILIVQIVIVALMAFGVVVNMAIYLSFASVISVAALVSADAKFVGFKLLAFLGGGDEHTYLSILHKMYSEDLTLKQAAKISDYAIVVRALRRCEDDMKKAEVVLGVSRSTIKRRIADGKSVLAFIEERKSNPGLVYVKESGS